jgi:hypothetical protein
MKKLAIGLGILFLLALAMPVLAAGAVVQYFSKISSVNIG